MNSLHALNTGLEGLLVSYGYLAVFAIVLLESMGVPSPGETMLLTAAAYAGATHKLDIRLVVLAAFLAGVVGDNAGYWIGREGGWRLIRRYGRFVRIDETTIKVAVYLFRRYGSWVVFVGRFIPVLRTWGAFLAGVTRFPWRRFIVVNLVSAFTWAAAWGIVADLFGRSLSGISHDIALIAIAVASAISLLSAALIGARRRELRREAEMMFPGSIDRIAA